MSPDSLLRLSLPWLGTLEATGRLVVFVACLLAFGGGLVGMQVYTFTLFQRDMHRGLGAMTAELQQARHDRDLLRGAMADAMAACQRR